MTLQKYLAVLLLLAAVFLVQLNAFAHEVKPVATKSSCACHLPDFSTDEGSGQPEHSPDSHTVDFCDCEGCCPDVTEPSSVCKLRVTVSVAQLFHLPATSFFPKVYLTIFVPPES